MYNFIIKQKTVTITQEMVIAIIFFRMDSKAAAIKLVRQCNPGMDLLTAKLLVEYIQDNFTYARDIGVSYKTPSEVIFLGNTL